MITKRNAIKIKKEKINKKGQIDFPLIGLAVLMLLLIILAPIILKVINAFRTPFVDKLTAMNQIQAAQATDKVYGTFTNFWDKVIIFVFVISVILLFLSSFLINTNPIWMVLYILTFFFLIIILPNIVDGTGMIWDSSNFINETNQLPITNNVRTHYMGILLGLGIITGIIIYGKFNWGGGNLSR